MALVFGLVADFGGDLRAARAAAAVAAASGPLAAGPHRIAPHPPLPWTDPSGRVEMSVVPRGVGSGTALDGDRPRTALTAAEYTALGRALYDLLRAMHGYRAAAVGWNAEPSVDPAELRAARAADPHAWGDDGLVLADTVLAGLGGDDRFLFFAPGFSYLPWRGVRPSSLTADPAP
ncbi:hypothetical protein [Nocardiopsis flavescens]